MFIDRLHRLDQALKADFSLQIEVLFLILQFLIYPVKYWVQC